MSEAYIRSLSQAITVYTVAVLLFFAIERPNFCSQTREHRKFAVEEGDHLTMLNVFEAFIKVRVNVLPWDYFIS